MNSLTTKRILNTLAPSPSSFFSGFLLGLIIVIAAYFYAGYVGSYESLQVSDIHAGAVSDNPLISRYQSIYDSVVQSNLLGAASLFVFWSVVGLVGYMTIAGIAKSLKDINNIKDELDYVHVDKKALYKEEGEKLAIRVVMLGVFFAFLHLFSTYLVPIVFELAKIGGAEAEFLLKIGYAIVAILIMTLAVHVLIVILRLLMLRVRVFGEEVPEEELGR